MSGEPPVSSEVLADIPRGPKARVIVRSDEWQDGQRSVNVAVHRLKPSGEWYARRSVTIYPGEIDALISALERARESFK